MFDNPCKFFFHYMLERLKFQTVYKPLKLKKPLLSIIIIMVLIMFPGLSLSETIYLLKDRYVANLTLRSLIFHQMGQ